MCTEHSTRELDFTNDKVETKLLTLKLQAENDPNSFVFQLDHLATAAFSSGYVHLLLKSNSLERSTALVVNGVEVPGSFQHAESVETYMREESVSVKVEEPEAGEDPSVVAAETAANPLQNQRSQHLKRPHEPQVTSEVETISGPSKRRKASSELFMVALEQRITALEKRDQERLSSQNDRLSTQQPPLPRALTPAPAPEPMVPGDVSMTPPEDSVDEYVESVRWKPWLGSSLISRWKLPLDIDEDWLTEDIRQYLGEKRIGLLVKLATGARAPGLVTGTCDMNHAVPIPCKPGQQGILDQYHPKPLVTFYFDEGDTDSDGEADFNNLTGTTEEEALDRFDLNIKHLLPCNPIVPDLPTNIGKPTIRAEEIEVIVIQGRYKSTTGTVVGINGEMCTTLLNVPDKLEIDIPSKYLSRVELPTVWQLHHPRTQLGWKVSPRPPPSRFMPWSNRDR